MKVQISTCYTSFCGSFLKFLSDKIKEEQNLSLMETMSKSPRTSIDRFSSLPDHVAHSVLSYVSIEDISRLCLVSRRFRQLCLSVPYLTFDVIPYRDNAVKRARLMNYLERLLFLRKGMDTQRFYVRWCLQNGLVDEEYRILSWLQSAVVCNVELLDLDINLGKESADFLLPPSAVCCRSLRFLRVNLHSGTLNFPSPITNLGFCSLQSISLQSVRINDSFGEWISSNCKFLKELCLEDIRGTKSIEMTSSSLEILKILSPHDLFKLQVSAEMLGRMALRWRFDSPAERVLQLSTPKLKSMFWEGNILNFRCINTFMHLATAGIFFRLTSDLNARTTENLFRVLRSVCNIRVLAVHDKCIQVLFKHGCLPTLFSYLLTLHIFTTGISKDFVPAMESLLKGTPNLRCLSISGKFMQCQTNTKRVNGEGKEKWGLKNLLFMHNLKYVTIEIIREGKYELELIKYLLKHANNLKKMTVFCASPLQSDVSREIKEYEKGSDAELNFHQL